MYILCNIYIKNITCKRIVGGKPAQRGQFPWQVVNRYNLPTGQGFCGGALISPQWVLTAGHCVKGANSFHVTLGTLISDVEEEEGKVMIITTKAILHENYNPMVLKNDIALLDLGRKVAFTDVISSIGLGTQNLGAGVSLTISGWGKTSDNATLTSLELNYVETITITNKKCYEIFDNVVDEIMCCSGANSKSACRGDSGGPLVQKLPNGSWIHVGVMSFVHKQGCAKGFPSAYTRTSRIIDGKPAVPGQFPWQVVNRVKLPAGGGFCGGALIGSQWVLTAGHCVKGGISFNITLGTLISDGEEEEGKVMITTTKAIIHENYNPLLLHNDIGLIDLDRKVTFTDVISPIGLGTQYLSAGVSVTISGWGKTSDNATLPSLELNYVEMTTITNKKCYEIFDTVVDEMICCRGANSKNACQGDTGGPLVHKLPNGSWIHVGVLSFVHKQGCAKCFPSVYMRTSSYRAWIKKNTGI
ncbi:hypothetical protein RI129_009433 [Pyrocoelia pectoralis]|uniref:Peptidase S1 domain-containing protein n=1 Tax=Pyrocoelia pectoralis TaxID=417401 RepID=A0AAN7V8G3_9COLE